MVSAEQHGHLSDKNYWSEKYAGELARAIDVRDRGLRNYFRRYHHKVFSQKLREHGFGKGSRLLEVGCGASIWLPYFAREHGFQVTGLDYSEKGCATAEYVLRRDGADGKVVCGDLFDPPADMIGAFDVVTSFGVVEHFESTAEAVTACARFLRPGGVVMTIIPNLAGLSGAGVKFFDPKLYAIHVAMTKEQLGRAHAEAGLEVLDCRYLTPAWFSDWSVPADDNRRGRRLLRNLLWYPTAALSAGAWVLDDLIGNRLPGSRWFSPWAICWARRPAGTIAPQQG